MSLAQRNLWINFVWYQSLWLTAVAGGPKIIAALLLLLVAHLLGVECWRSELGLMLGCALPGCFVDSLLAHLGVFVFSPAPALMPIPLWLIAIWLGFAGTLRGSLSWLSGRPLLMAILAGIGAPLAYLGAARLGAVSFPLGMYRTSVIVGAVWIGLSPWLCWMTSQARIWQAERQAARNAHSKEDVDHVR